MSEVAPAGGGPNRMFLVIVLGLIGLLILGAIAVGGIILIPQVFRPAPSATVRIAAATATRVIPAATVPILQPTDAPPPTATLVVGPITVAPVTVVTTTTGTVTVPVTGTITGTGTPGTGNLPTTGLGEDLLLLAAGVVLVLVIFAARRARAPGRA